MERRGARVWVLALLLGAAAPAGAGEPRLGDAPAVAQELAAALRAGGLAAKVVGKVEVQLAGVGLRLRVSDERQPDDAPSGVHVHVTAAVPGGAPGGLEACILGTPDEARTSHRAAAESYAQRAFPAILGLVREDASTTAVRFGGTESVAVPGYRGLAGPVVTIGEDGHPRELDRALAGGPLFGGIAKLPDDGRPHLLKAVLLGKDGAWQRTLELDGKSIEVSPQPWKGIEGPKEPVVVIRYAAFWKRDAFANAEARAAALKRLEAHEPWLFGALACPATAAPARLFSPPFGGDACKGGRLLDCLDECKAGSGPSCFAAAVETQRKDRVNSEAEALFLRACRLGVAAGCTNRAAGMARARGTPGGLAKGDDCPERTYAAVCERAGDPWACVMLGSALVTGDHLEPDRARARRALARACERDEADAACKTARSMLDKLRELETVK